MPDSNATINDSTIQTVPMVLFYQRHKRVFATQLDSRLEIGRQRAGEPDPYRRLDRTDHARVVLAPLNDVDVSRSHISIELLPESGNVKVKNLSRSQPVKLSADTILGPGDEKTEEIPFLAQFSSYAVRIDPPEDEELILQPLPERTMAPGRQSIESSLSRLNIDTMDERLLLRWLETVLGVFQSAANSQDFPEMAAKAVVKIVGLDAAAMLECNEEGRWETASLHSIVEGQNEETWIPSQTLLAQVKKQKRTYRHVPASDQDTAKSLQDVSALVAAPILDGNDNVIGALYGDRRIIGSGTDCPDITPFEAKLVEVLASGIAAGLARVKEEQAALSARIKLEQFTTPKIARQLEEDPQLLEGRNALITLLFADIRGFSQISEKLGPAQTMNWIQDTMKSLSLCVQEFDGVLVDYIGDELMAMWGAPIAQPNHADLACKAAQEMLRVLPEINQRWKDKIDREMELGIGLNSGIAQVGNTGSDLKFKYGPLGDTVNIASRVQGATKYFGTECLITGSTLAAMDSKPVTRRLARVRVVNIEQHIDLYEVCCTSGQEWSERCLSYTKALEALEKKELQEAEVLIRDHLAKFSDDPAAVNLAGRITEARHLGTVDTGVWSLPGK